MPQPKKTPASPASGAGAAKSEGSALLSNESQANAQLSAATASALVETQEEYECRKAQEEEASNALLQDWALLREAREILPKR